MAEPLAYEGTGYEVVEQEPPELLGRNLVSASYLLAGATAFFFVAFVFAYFYLRSLEQRRHVEAEAASTPPSRWGTAVVACYVASALLVRLGLTDHRALRRGRWRLKGLVALLVGVAGLVLQVVAWTHEGFGPADGGFASVYFGWTAFLFLFVLGTLLWLEMTVATSFRYRNAPSGPAPGHASGDPDRMAHDIRDPLSLVRAELVGAQLLLDVPRGDRGRQLGHPLPDLRWIRCLSSCAGRRRRCTPWDGAGGCGVWREVSFYSGVALAFVVLEPPFDDWADTWLSAHMSQHIVLMTVVPPLVVLGRPVAAHVAAVPARARGAPSGGALSRSSPFRRSAGFLERPWVALAVQSAMVALWHVPQLYDAAARNEWIHVLEHVCFVAPALVFWGALLDAPPVRARIDHLHRAVWFAAAMVPAWILAIVPRIRHRRRSTPRTRR